MAGETHESTEAKAHHDEGAAFPPFDASTFPSQLLWLALTFGALYYLMSRVALPRIAEILETRRDRIASDLGDAERLRQETDDAIASYEQALAEARAKASATAQEARDKAAAEMAKHQAEADASFAARMAEADSKISSMKADALSNVETIATDAAASIVETLLGESADGKEVAGAVAAAAKA